MASDVEVHPSPRRQFLSKTGIGAIAVGAGLWAARKPLFARPQDPSSEHVPLAMPFRPEVLNFRQGVDGKLTETEFLVRIHSADGAFWDVEQYNRDLAVPGGKEHVGMSIITEYDTSSTKVRTWDKTVAATLKLKQNSGPTPDWINGKLLMNGRLWTATALGKHPSLNPYAGMTAQAAVEKMFQEHTSQPEPVFLATPAASNVGGGPPAPQVMPCLETCELACELGCLLAGGGPYCGVACGAYCLVVCAKLGR